MDAIMYGTVKLTTSALQTAHRTRRDKHKLLVYVYKESEYNATSTLMTIRKF